MINQSQFSVVVFSPFFDIVMLNNVCKPISRIVHILFPGKKHVTQKLC